MSMFCSECGTKSVGGKFCVNCGTKLVQPDSVVIGESAWPDVKVRLSENWKHTIEVAENEFDSFSLSDWKELQSFLSTKSGHYLGCRTFSEFQFKLAEYEQISQPILDTMETLDQSISKYIANLDAQSKSQKLMAAVGTKTQLPFMPPSSGESYYYPAVENAIAELDTLINVLKIGRTDNLIGESFDDHLDAISLMSDFARSFLVLYIGDTEKERAWLSSWGPRRGEIANDMTAVAVAGLSSELVSLPPEGMLNPRMVLMAVDSDNTSFPWWMEMGFWASVAEEWKSRIRFDVDDMNLEVLASGVRNALDPNINKDALSLRLFSQDKETTDVLLEFLES